MCLHSFFTIHFVSFWFLLFSFSSKKHLSGNCFTTLIILTYQTFYKVWEESQLILKNILYSVYGAESRQDILYSILKDSLKTEDVAKMENDAAKNSHEVYQALRNSRGLHDSYLYRFVLIQVI